VSLLSLNSQLGPYEIAALIGAGGMGEVYKARDTRLNRTVAIKVLRPDFADQAGWKVRFAREAETIASLNHPHICVLHDVGSHAGVDYLVMEYLEGETLEQRLEKGPLPLDKAVEIGMQICHALDRAHVQGIVHRDLKPSNVMLTKVGAKLLDFGLAKTQTRVVPHEKNSSLVSTLQDVGDFKLVGTPQYMSPEQLRGQEPDVRTDIFALGEILYEMVTGAKTFQGKSQMSLLAAILENEPKPISEISRKVPPAFEHLVKTCLAKDPEKRWQSACDISLHLAWIKKLVEHGSTGIDTSPHSARRWLAGGVLVLLVLFVAIAVGTFAALKTGTTSPSKSVTQFFVRPPEQRTFPAFRAGINGGNLPALSPDGHKLVVALSEPSGQSMLWLQRLDSTNAQPLAGTDEAAFPFWSPDSSSIGFFSEGKLKKVPEAGGSVQVICDAPSPRGGTWNKQGVILFASGRNAIYKVAAAGGDPVPALKLDEAHGETSHRWPYFLPDDQHFVYWSPGTGSNHSEIHLASLGSFDNKLLFLTDSNAVYDSSGYLIFIRQNKLLAQPFDMSHLQLRGDSVQIADEIAYSPDGTLGEFSVSDTGILAYRKGGTSQTQLAWYGRDGKQIGETVAAGKEYLQVNLSPDNKQAVAHVSNGMDHTPELWLIDLLRGVPSRFTFGSSDSDPIWSPNGDRVVFTSRRKLQANLFWKALNGNGTEDLLLDAGAMTTASDWSKDGKYIAYLSGPEPGRQDIYALKLPDKQTIPVLKSKFNKDGVRFSPDGRWIAFHSNPTGIMEVYVTTFPASESDKVWQISNGGGAQSRWRSDGRELFYLTLDGKLMSVDIAGGNELNPGVAKMLFRSRVPVQHQIDQYAVSADGHRFLMIIPTGNPESVPITVVLNWK